MKTRCPICDEPGKQQLVVQGFRIFGCNVCLHRWLADPLTEDHIQTHYGDSYFECGGAGYDNYTASEQVVRRRSQFYLRTLEKLVDGPKSILGVGAAAGYELGEFQHAGWQVAAIEPNQKMAQLARCHIGDCVQNSSLEEADFDQPFNVVTLMQVAAHLQNLTQCMEKLAKLTRPRGYLVVETWNYRSWSARFFGKHWHEYSPPSVLHWFTPTSLDKLARNFGFRQVQGGKPRKHITAEHAKSLIHYKSQAMPGGAMLRATSRLIPNWIALPYPGDDVFWCIYRKDAE